MHLTGLHQTADVCGVQVVQQLSCHINRVKRIEVDTDELCWDRGSWDRWLQRLLLLGGLLQNVG